MYSKAKNFLSTKEIIGYTLPRIHRGKSYYVDFFAYDPTTDRLKRKRYMLDRYHNKAEREKIAAVLVYTKALLPDLKTTMWLFPRIGKVRTFRLVVEVQAKGKWKRLLDMLH